MRWVSVMCELLREAEDHPLLTPVQQSRKSAEKLENYMVQLGMASGRIPP